MNNPIQDAMMIAQNTEVGNPLYELAVAVCIVRGVTPTNWRGQLTEWQTVIAEEYLRECMQDVVENGGALPGT